MKKTGIYKKMLTLATVPILLFGIVLTIFCYVRFRETLYEETKNNMAEIAHYISITYDKTYPGDYSLVANSEGTYDFYKGDTNITNDYSIVDSFAREADTEISVLYMDMRIHTTFKTKLGKRMAGISTNEDTAVAVIRDGSDVFYKNVSIPNSDTEYLIYYVPLRNSDDSVIGMIEVAKRTSEIKGSVMKAVWPMLLLAIPGMALVAFLSFGYTKGIVNALKKIQDFLGRIATGNLSAEMPPECISREDELGDIAKSSIQMARSIRASVETDPLTGLNNRRYVHSAVARIAARSEMTGVPFTIAICDIDFFKKVNDTYGHNAGDEVLKAVASQLKKAMIGNGFAARWGGEEFVLIFDRSGVEDSVKIMEKMADNIRAMIVYTEGYEIKITMTMGVSPGTSGDVEAIVESADEKLYYGKEHGRNQIVWELPKE
ncbi:MAG: diguanylate cyclase [Lachnospiraceae bacterium]|nr:diguanylate cyclase [Lachnospiraceae bacterium]